MASWCLHEALSASSRDWLVITCESGNILVTFLDNNTGNDTHVGVDDATTSGLLLAFTCASGTVTRMTWTSRSVCTRAIQPKRTLGHEQLDTLVGQDTLSHGETLLVVTTFLAVTVLQNAADANQRCGRRIPSIVLREYRQEFRRRCAFRRRHGRRSHLRTRRSFVCRLADMTR